MNGENFAIVRQAKLDLPGFIANGTAAIVAKLR
jgi:hypothetical protein